MSFNSHFMQKFSLFSNFTESLRTIFPVYVLFFSQGLTVSKIWQTQNMHFTSLTLLAYDVFFSA